MKIDFDDILDIFKQKYSDKQSDIDLFILGWNECVIGWNPTITDKSYSKFSTLVLLKDFDYFLFGWNCCEAFFYNVNGIWQLFERENLVQTHYLCISIMKTLLKDVVISKVNEINNNLEFKKFISEIEKDFQTNNKKPPYDFIIIAEEDK